MEQSHRILSIYTRLIQQKVVNKDQLVQEWNVSPRTIQRDIDNIRNFLYDTDEWHGYRKEITYNHRSASYTMSSSNEDHTASIYFLIALLQTITPVIEHQLSDYLKLLIKTFHSHHEPELLYHLNKLKVGNQVQPCHNLTIANRAINQHQKLYMSGGKEITPLYIRYQGFTFHLVYHYQQQTMITDLGTTDLTFSPEYFTPRHSQNYYQEITFEMHTSLYKSMQYFYEHKIIKPQINGYCIVRFKMCPEDAVNLCFSCCKQIRIIEPADVRHKVFHQLLKLQETYMLNHLFADY
ncbi:helix-turn-helix transcriptional regulator [Staphylococcus debuckii]|uniref:helix-turn-helix transcriptional regulator n=1 Tax=Staphylococcus debuckii TaxID=2044912 RepID=UPI000F4325DE|nr:HTH domain-containing protein [Staphylococcus debuckii]AYU54468.1 HTH domain-containing protein [Staphylococcus debuckii]